MSFGFVHAQKPTNPGANLIRPVTFSIQRSSDKSNVADLLGRFCFHFGHRLHDRARILDLIFLCIIQSEEAGFFNHIYNCCEFRICLI